MFFQRPILFCFFFLFSQFIFCYICMHEFIALNRIYRSFDLSNRYPLHVKFISKRISFSGVCTTLTLNTEEKSFCPFWDSGRQFIGGWIQFGVTVGVRHNKMAVWAKQPHGGDPAPRILRKLIRPPANFRQSLAYFWAILCEPCSQKSRFFLVQRYFLL